MLLEREVEAATIDFANPFIHLDHLAAAAYEGPLTADDARFFGPQLSAALEQAAEDGLVRRKNDAWYFAGSGFRQRRSAWRSTAGEQYTIVEGETGDIVGTEGAETAFSALHPGAVYLHMGDAYLVTELDLDGPRGSRPPVLGFVSHPSPPGDRHPHPEREPTGLSRPAHPPPGADSRHHPGGGFPEEEGGQQRGSGYRGARSPRQEFITEAMWFTIPAELFSTEADLVKLPGAIHAVEHALIALLPLFAMCDRWDIGGLSTPAHSQTEQPTIFIYDGHREGSGSPARASSDFLNGSGTPIAWCGTVSARAGAPPASNRRSAVTGTSPSTRKPLSGFWRPCSRRPMLS